MVALILGKQVDFDLELSDAGERRAELTAMFDDMAGHINRLSASWSPQQAEVFRLTNRLVVFRKNKYKGRTMTRSYMAQQDRVFYWTFDEFIRWEPGARRPTAYYHDAWHVQQYIDHGEAPNDMEVLIDREQDAMARQLEVARVLDCDQAMIDFLTGYAGDRDKIRQRLTEGVGLRARVRPHFLVVD